MADAMSSEVPSSKRFRGAADTLELAPGVGLFSTDPDPWGNADPNVNLDGWTGFFQDNQWENVFIPLPAEDVSPEYSDAQVSASRKRRRSSPFGDFGDLINLGNTSEAAVWFHTTYPDLLPDASQLPPRIWAPEILNPFLDKEVLRHPRTRRNVVPVVIPQDGYINGLIKIRLNLSKYRQQIAPVARLQKFPWVKPKYVEPLLEKSSEDVLPLLPPDFGRELRLSGIDEKFFNFFRIAVCGAVTLIPNENCYLREIIPIAVRSDCVKHAILALAATYVLDYSGEDHVRTRASLHWKRAVHLLTRELSITESCKPGKENVVIAAMTLFSHNEVVNWEADQVGEECPPWYKATLLAEQVLEKSDPLYHYQSPTNVQCSRARIQLGNKIALYNIMSATIWPLDTDQTKCPFTWLVEGTETELRRIVGCTGLCPRLMHTYAQITHLSAKLYKDPKRLAARKLGRAIGERLENFWQWSDLSQGYPSSQALLASCELDENGKVFSATKTTELVAESFAAAAQVYLYCRLMKKSRRHPHVQKMVDRLLWIIDRMPTSGPFFTAQHAQLRVFIGAVAAVEQRHRDLVRAWFEDLVSGTRGNVPPVWRTVQFMWDWLDERLGPKEAESQDTSDITEISVDAEPWWEQLVTEIYKREGKLNLA